MLLRDHCDCENRLLVGQAALAIRLKAHGSAPRRDSEITALKRKAAARKRQAKLKLVSLEAAG